MQLAADIAWGLIALICAGAVLGFLRVTGSTYSNAMMLHNLKVNVHRLRIAQQRRLFEIAMSETETRDRGSLPPEPGTEEPGTEEPGTEEPAETPEPAVSAEAPAEAA